MPILSTYAILEMSPLDLTAMKAFLTLTTALLLETFVGAPSDANTVIGTWDNLGFGSDCGKWAFSAIPFDRHEEMEIAPWLDSCKSFMLLQTDRAAIDGTTTPLSLSFRIGWDAKVTNVQIVESSGSVALDSRAISAMKAFSCRALPVPPNTLAFERLLLLRVAEKPTLSLLSATQSKSEFVQKD